MTEKMIDYLKLAIQGRIQEIHRVSQTSSINESILRNNVFLILCHSFLCFFCKFMSNLIPYFMLPPTYSNTRNALILYISLVSMYQGNAFAEYKKSLSSKNHRMYLDVTQLGYIILETVQLFQLCMT